MAFLIPNEEELALLPNPLRRSEKQLVDALKEVLDESWNIYVQPHINGLNPDVVIFSKFHGIAIFEVKEWALGMYKIEMLDKNEKAFNQQNRKQPSYRWLAIKPNSEVEVGCPFRQIERYKNAIFQYEIPDMSSETVTDSSFYGLIGTFVYFSGFSAEYLHAMPNLDLIRGSYTEILGDDDLEKHRLTHRLQKRYLIGRESRFSEWLKEHDLVIQNTFYPPMYGKTDLKYINSEATPKQKDLIPNEIGRKRRVLGVAGSGKTFVLVKKTLEAARNDKKVLLVTFNITMANLIRDLVFRLSRIYGPHVHRNIEVAHYHRLKYGTTDEMTGQAEQTTLSTYSGKPIDVLLIDEGQDFESEWVSDLLAICKPEAHTMFVEDDRQNIYKRSQVRIPEFRGRPNLLNETHRIPAHLSRLANALYEYFQVENQSGPLEPIRKAGEAFDLFPAKWLNATSYRTALSALIYDIGSQNSAGRLGRPEDNVVLVCQVHQGWDIEDGLNRLSITQNRMFESKQEAEQLKEKFGIKSGWDPETDVEDNASAENLKRKADAKITWQQYRLSLETIRRRYKVAFRMRTDGLKLSTIHSFKGWELEHIYILFAPDEKQFDAAIPLLYTALTRSQDNVTIYNVNEKLAAFGDYAMRQGLVAQWQPST